MRLLLNHVRGAGASGYDAEGRTLGYADLMKNKEGQVCPTYKEAAMQLGLLADDTEWDRCSFDEFLLGANMMILCPYSQDQDEFLTCIIKGGVYSSVFCPLY